MHRLNFVLLDIILLTTIQTLNTLRHEALVTGAWAGYIEELKNWRRWRKNWNSCINL